MSFLTWEQVRELRTNIEKYIIRLKAGAGRIQGRTAGRSPRNDPVTMHPGLIASCACRLRPVPGPPGPAPGPLRRQCGYIQCGGSIGEVYVIPAGAEYGVQIRLGVAVEDPSGYDDFGELLG